MQLLQGRPYRILMQYLGTKFLRNCPINPIPFILDIYLFFFVLFSLCNCYKGGLTASLCNTTGIKFLRNSPKNPIPFIFDIYLFFFVLLLLSPYNTFFFLVKRKEREREGKDVPRGSLEPLAPIPSKVTL